jgi:PIN domain nuclease of toxin-antitoxin system
VVRWLAEPRRLSQEQVCVLGDAVRRGEPFAVSAITLLRIAVLGAPVSELLAAIDPGAGFHIVPLDIEIGAEVAALGDVLRDPADRAIVATARVHRLRLVTSDQRIIESKLVAVVE